MAGIMALVEQKIGSRVGNANYVLYKLAGQQTPANCNSTTGSGSGCVFNDVTTGTIAMPCAKGSLNCTTTLSSDQYGVLSGYSAGTGYDLATGLGSVNAANLVTKWSGVTLTPSVTTLTSLAPTTITHGQAVNVSIGVAPQSGSGTPTGAVSLMSDLSKDNAGIGSFTLNGSGLATGTTDSLPGGTYQVTAHYAGDGTFGSSDSSPVSITVNKENSSTQVGLVDLTLSNGQVVATRSSSAVYGAPYFIRADVTGSECPSNGRVDPGCPTGNLTVTSDGNPIGTFALNSAGYMEDQYILLPGGTHAVQAQYAGDSSFNSSSATSSITITPAVSATAAPTVPTQSSAGVSIYNVYIRTGLNRWLGANGDRHVLREWDSVARNCCDDRQFERDQYFPDCSPWRGAKYAHSKPGNFRDHRDLWRRCELSTLELSGYHLTTQISHAVA